MSRYRWLREGWTVTNEARGMIEIPATVPGCVHLDLLAAGLIEEPYRGDAEDRLQWIARSDWVYETSFDWQPDGHERADLVCEGLDTVAAVFVNGAALGTTANMHRSYRFNVGGLLAPGANRLRVVFASPYEYAERQRARLGDRPASYDEPYQFIRKMACNFGWDWSPTLVTSGIWRPIGLHSWSTARLAEVRPVVTVADGEGRVDLHVAVERAADVPLTVTAAVAGASGELSLRPGQCRGVIRLRVPSPRLWWPRGHGDQALYPLTVRLGEETWTRRIGFRSVDLDTTPDPAGGSAFALRVNGTPVFVKGFNWIPDDCFPARVTEDRLAHRFEQAVGAGANLLRVWGGGLYESEEFYDLADRLGLLVWQDFLFACAAYPEEEPFRGEVEAEAREQVARLACHPSLAVWCGNNENLEGHANWGWREELNGRTWGAGFYHDLLPRIVSELDPTRPYWPGSPYSGTPDADVQDPSRGTVHIWTVWNREDYTHFGAYTPRFVAEFGFQGPPTYATLREAAPEGPLTPESSHQKAADGQRKLLRGLGDHLPQPASFDDWHYYTQLNQARAVSYGIERFRALGPYCMGAIVWQLNDCWPVTSWSAVDGYGRRKPLWHALRRAYADRLLTFQDDTVVAINDTGQPWTGELALARRAVTGEPLAKESIRVRVAPRAVTAIPLPPALAVPESPTLELLDARLGEERALRCLAEDTAMRYPPASFDTAVESIPDGVRLRIAARTIVRDLAIFPDRLDPEATIDDQLVTLLPGETAAFVIRASQDIDAAALTAYPVLRCVNEPGSGRRGESAGEGPR